MSYDLRVCVNVEGCDKYADVGYPEYDSPTYNLSAMFVACMGGWDYDQHTHYPAAFALEKIEHGISELESKPGYYEQYNPPNGWGNLEGALKSLKSARDCIHECEEEYPIECLYFHW